MSDNQRLDQLLREMSELTETIKGRAGDATIDKDFVEEQFKGLHKQIADIQAKANEPVRRVPGEGIPAIAPESVKATNRYKPMLKALERDGKLNWGGTEVKAIDLFFAKRILDAQTKSAPSFAGGVGKQASDDLNEVIKALSSTTAAAGDELVPTGMAGQMWQDFYLASRVMPSMMRVPMPTNPFDVPLALGDITWYGAGENSAVSETTPATAKSTLTAKEIVAEVNWSYTMDEDAVIALAPGVRERIVQSGAETMDSFLLNADATTAATGNINSDDAAPAANAFYLSAGQDGIRHQWLVDHTNMGSNAGGDALTDLDVTGALAKMGKYAADPMRLVIFSDISTYLNGFLQTGTGKPGEYVSTLDKFGSDAIIRTGQLASYRGIPIVVSASHPKGEADGKVSATAASNTLGSFSVVNTTMWYAGVLRDLLIETDVDIRKRQYILVASFRLAVGTHGTRSTNTHTGGVYNILV